MSIDVLLVEDSAGDVRLMQEAFHNINASVRLHLAGNGLEAMAFLRQEGIYANAPQPDLILLDLKMPKMDGRAVLAEIKKDEKLKAIPTVILTTSEAEADVLISYQLHANCYLRKPTHWDAFDDLVRCINDFWLTKSKLPQKKKSLEIAV